MWFAWEHMEVNPRLSKNGFFSSLQRRQEFDWSALWVNTIVVCLVFSRSNSWCSAPAGKQENALLFKRSWTVKAAEWNVATQIRRSQPEIRELFCKSVLAKRANSVLLLKIFTNHYRIQFWWHTQLLSTYIEPLTESGDLLFVLLSQRPHDGLSFIATVAAVRLPPSCPNTPHRQRCRTANERSVVGEGTRDRARRRFR